MTNETYKIFDYIFEHLEYATPFGDPITSYRVKTKEGWYIRKPTFAENVYKTVTFLYATDDLANVIVTDTLPQGVEIMNGINNVVIE